MKLPAIAIAAALMTTPVMAADTFTFTLASNVYNGAELDDPTGSRNFVLDLREVRAFFIETYGVSCTLGQTCVPMPVPNPIAVQISLDNGTTWECLGNSCAFATTPSGDLNDEQLAVSPRVGIPLSQRKDNALLRFAYEERNNPPAGCPYIMEGYIQFFR